MKTTDLANKLLKYMVSKYHKAEKTVFYFDEFKQQFPKCSVTQLNQALYMLEAESCVSVMPADNVAYLTTLLPTGISQCEHNTKGAKFYRFLVELWNVLKALTSLFGK